jgi:hypothetical protein
MGATALVAGAAAGAATIAPSLPLLIAIQVVAGAAWAGIIVAAFAWALVRGGTGQAGAFAGAISSVLALATLLRMGSISAGWPKAPGYSDALIWWPLVGWLLASMVIVALVARGRSAAFVPART